MLRSSRALLPFALAVVLAACAPGPGTPVDLSSLCRVDNDGQRVAVEGYVGAGSSIFCSNIGGGPVTCGLQLSESPDGEAASSLYIVEGGGGSEIETVPDDWTRASLRIHAEDGSLVGAGDLVRITGKASVVEGENAVCFVTADVIEKVAAPAAG